MNKPMKRERMAVQKQIENLCCKINGKNKHNFYLSVTGGLNDGNTFEIKFNNESWDAGYTQSSKEKDRRE